MFSAIFGKRRSSPVEDDAPPIPGAKPDDVGYVFVDPAPVVPRGGLYPSVSGGGYPAPLPQRPAPHPPAPVHQKSEETFHYLQGVPFNLCKELQMASNKDTFASEISDILAFLSNKMNMSGYEYNFTVERSVLKEC